jgi:hypothetical protein
MFAIAAGCSSPHPTTPASAPPIDPAACQNLAASQHEHCGADLKAAIDNCNALARLAEAASCAAPALRSFECGTREIASCSDEACCTHNLDRCDDINTPLDHCARGYCGGHAGNPDCAAVIRP